jgi:AraC family transcriptional regulator
MTSRYMFRDERVRTCAALLDRDGGRPGHAAYTRSLTTALFAATVESAKVPRERSQDGSLNATHWNAICEYVRDRLGRPIALEAVANVVQMPPARFGRAFRRATGMSLRQWQVDCRIRCAQRLLLDDPRESLAKVAGVCGFADQSHFSRAFVKTVGAAPASGRSARKKPIGEQPRDLCHTTIWA